MMTLTETSPHYKQAIILRADLGMGKGKLVAQGSHASLNAALKVKLYHANIFNVWQKEQGYKKIVLKVNSEKELLDIYTKSVHLEAVLVRDWGLTQLDPDTPTAVGIGPALEKQVDAITKELKLL